LYKDRNIIFTQFSKNSPIFSIRKWKAKNDADDKEVHSEVKVTEQETEFSVFDKIVAGDKKGIKVLFEDEKCIAFEDKAPIAKQHFIVLAKDPKASLGNMDFKDAELYGHLLVKASQVAKQLEMADGYRVVANHGRNAFQTIPNLYLHVIGGQQLKWPPTAPLNEKAEKAEKVESS